MASLGIGSFVWVEDPDEAWIDGKVVGVNGENIEVLCTSGKMVRTFTAIKGVDLLSLISNCTKFHTEPNRY